MSPLQCSDRMLILSRIANTLNIDINSIDLSKSFTQLGGHSLSAVEVAQDCKCLVKNPPSVLTLLISPDLNTFLPKVDLTPDLRDPGLSASGTTTPSLVELSDDGITPPLPSRPTFRKLISFGEMIRIDDGVLQEASTFFHPESPSLGVDVEPLLIPDAVPEPLKDQSPKDAVNLSDPNEAPATDIQLGLIRGRRSTIQYHETWSLENVVIIKHAWKTVIMQEPIFRAKFAETSGGDVIMRLGDANFPWEDIVTFDRESYRQEVQKPRLHLQPGYSFNNIVYSCGESGRSEATIAFSIHHALLDGYSMEILVNKVRHVASGGELAPQGNSFLTAAKELETIRSNGRLAAESFWKEKRANAPTASSGMKLPIPREPIRPHEDNEVCVNFCHLKSKMSETCQRFGVTSAALFYAAWALTQALYSDSDAVKVGSIYSGRSLAVNGICSVIGPLINSLPVYINVDRSMSTKDFAWNIFKDLAELSTFEWSSPEHGFDRDFEAALSVTGKQFVCHCGINRVHPCKEPTYHFESNIPLSLALNEEELVLRLVYHVDKFTRSTAEDLASCFVSAMTTLTSQQGARVQQCLDSLITVPMQGRLRELGNCMSGATTRGAHHEDIVSLFETTVKAYPTSIALDAGDGNTWTYEDLDKKTQLLAHELRDLGVKDDDVVCVHADGSAEWIIGILAASRANAIMCSLDATLPHSLRSTNFQSSKSKVFVVGTESQRSFLPDDCSTCMIIDQTLSRYSESMDIELSSGDHTPRPCSPAYLCFTSGSTGTPKGVLCTHQGLVAFQKDEVVRLSAKNGVRVAQFMSPAFDGSVHEIFSALCYGATLVLRRNQDPFDVLERANSAIMTPSVANSLPASAFPNLLNVYLVGEQVPMPVVAEWAPGRALYNMYGPTEGTCGATITRLLPSKPVTIGHPNPTSRVYILGKQSQLLPPGSVGEIYIAGVQVSRGYVNHPEQNAYRFIPDTVCPYLGETMYRTGDRGYWDESGNIVCLGRNDRQLKLRGFRMDLDDLELQVLKAMPEVTAVALTKATKGNTLVAMVQPASVCPTVVRCTMKKILPAAAVPSALTCVDSLPLTHNGKVDLKAVAAAFEKPC